MSHSLYNLQWQHAMEALSALINEENPPPKLDDRRKPIPVSSRPPHSTATTSTCAIPPQTHSPSTSCSVPPSDAASQEPPITFYSAFVHCASLYLKYLGVFRQLEDCYDQMIHPQKRKDVRLTLELCMARVCQLRQDLLLYSSSQPSALSTPDHVHLDGFLTSLRLSPDALEVPIPRYFQEPPDDDEERKKRELVTKLCDENAVMWGTAGQDVGLISDEVQQQLHSMNRLTREQAIKIIQKNERGRQGAMRAHLMKELREEDARKKLRDSGVVCTRDDAATTIQRVWRGYAARKRVQEEELEELIFLGLKPSTSVLHQQTILAASPAAIPPPVPTSSSSASAPLALPKYEPLVKEQQIRQQRKTRQMDAALHFSDSLRVLEADIEAKEGEEMKQRMWDERYQWWIEEKEKTGKYPLDLSQFYIQRYPQSDQAKQAQAQDIKKKGKAGKKEKEAPPAADAKEGGGKGGKEEKKDKGGKEAKGAEGGGGGVADAAMLILGPTELVEHLSACVRSYAAVWLGKDESGNPDQSFDVEMAKASLRPLVEQRVQKAVDDRLAMYFDNIREKVAEKTATTTKKGKGGKAGGKAKASEGGGGEGTRPSSAAKGEESKEQLSKPSPAGSGAGTTRAASAEGVSAREGRGKDSGKGGGAKAAAAKKCCEGDKLCAHLSLQDMLALLIKMNILQSLPTAPITLAISTASPPPATSLRLASLQGDVNLVGSLAASATAPSLAPSSFAGGGGGGGGGGTHVDPSFQQLRAFFTETFILPLGSAFVHSTLPSPPPRSLLLFGPPGSGKSLTAKCIAHESGSFFFDLSTRNLDRKLGTRAEIAKLVHLIFAVARQLQPAVLYLDEVDRVFGASKSKKSAGELSKLRALLLQHALGGGLERGDRVLLVGCARCPHSDRVEVKELLDLFGPPHGKVVLMPLPDYPTRRTLWTYFIQQTGLNLTSLEQHRGFDLTTLALVSEGYTAGCIQQAVLSTLPTRRVAKMLELDRGVDTSELMTALSQTSYAYRGEYQANVAWLEQVTGVKERRRMKEVAEQKEQSTQEEEAAKPKKKK